MTSYEQVEPAENNVVTLPERAKSDPKRALTDFVRDHPALVIVGGLAVGAVVAALLPKGTTRKVAAKAAGMAEIVSAAGLAFGKGAMERAEATGEALRHQGENLGDRVSVAAKRARSAGEHAAERIERAIAPAGKAAASAGHSIADRVVELTSRIRH